MSAHTPGPWHTKQLHGHNRGWAVFSTHSDAKGTRTLRLDDYRAGGELRESDARLIAEAPAMLEALRDLFEHCAMVHKHWGEGSNARESGEAIARAQSILERVDQ